MKKHILIAVQMILAVAFVCSFLTAEVPTHINWLILVMILFTSYILGFSTKDRIAFLLAIIILEVSLTSFIVVQFPNTFNLGSDELFESQFAGTIGNEGRYDPKFGTGQSEDYYGYTSILHFPLSTLSILTGVTPYILARFLYPLILRLLFTSAIFLFIEYLMKDSRIAFFASLIYLFSQRLIIMLITRRLPGAIFIVLTLYALLRARDEKIWYALAVLFSLATVFSDRSQSVLLLFFLLGYVIYSLFSSKRLQKDALLLIIIHATSIMSWYLFFATTILRTDIQYISALVRFINNQFNFNQVVTDIGGTGGFHIYSGVERMITTLAQAAFLGFSVIALLYFILRFKGNIIEKIKIASKSPFLMYLVLLSILSYGIMAVLIFTPWFFISGVYLWLASLGIAIMLGFLISKIVIKILNIKISYLIGFMLIVLIAIGGLYAKYPPIVFTGEGNVLEFSESRPEELMHSGRWLQEHSKNHEIILGDRTIFDIYSGYYELRVIGGDNDYYGNLFRTNSTEIEETLMAPDYSFSHAGNTFTGRLNYFVLNENIFRYPSTNLGGGPLDIEYKYRLDKVFSLDKYYDDGTVNIYYNQYSRS